MKRHLFEPEQDMYVQNIGNIQNFFDPAKNNFGQAGHISIWVRSNGEVWADSVIAGDHGHWKQVASRTTAWRAWTAQWAKSYKTVWWWKLYFFLWNCRSMSRLCNCRWPWSLEASSKQDHCLKSLDFTVGKILQHSLMKIIFFFVKLQKVHENWLEEKNRLNTTWPHGPSLYYISKRTGWVGLENGHFCWRAALYLCW